MTRAIAALALLLAALAAWQWSRIDALQAKVELADERAAAAAQAAKDERAARATEAARASRLQEALDAEHHARTALEADVRRADAAAVSLRQRTRDLAVAARCPAANPTAASGGPPANPAADLLEELSGWIDEAAGEIALYAAKASIAGQLCERTYDALGPPQE